MGLKYRDSQGTETPVAGLNGTSGELVPSVALYQSGTVTVSAAESAYEILRVTFSTPMPDDDYVVVLSINGSSGVNWHNKCEWVSYENKTATGFNIAIGKPNDQPIEVGTTIKWQAFKLMTDEVHEADATAIAQNTANFAPAFSETTSYAVGDYVTYNNILYRCTTAHTAGTWVAGHFTQVTVGSDFVNIKNTLKKTNQVILDTGDSGGSVTYKKIVIGFSELTASRTNQALLLTGRAGESWIIGMVNAGGTSQAINCTQVVKGAEKIQDIKCAFTARTTADGDFIIYVKLGTYNSSLRVTTLTDYNGNVTAELSDITETEYNAVTNIATVNKLVTKSNLHDKYQTIVWNSTTASITIPRSSDHDRYRPYKLTMSLVSSGYCELVEVLIWAGLNDSGGFSIIRNSTNFGETLAVTTDTDNAVFTFTFTAMAQCAQILVSEIYTPA